MAGSPGDSLVDVIFREAVETDIPGLVEMLVDDALGATREDVSKPLNVAYLEAFSNINSDPNNQLIVVELTNKLAGMMQLTFIPYLTHTGSWRCLVEGVRISREARGTGLGTRMIEHAIERAVARGCKLVQLTSDKSRPDAIKFYRRLGFRDTHEGFKMKLE